MLILRHAEAAPPAAGTADVDRPLTARGLGQAERLGEALHQAGLVPDRVLASPALRARQTAQAVAAALGLPEAGTRWDARIYEADLARLLTVLAAEPSAARLLLVGHNPGLEGLLGYLGAPTGLAPGALVRLGIRSGGADLQPGTGRVLGRLGPVG